MNEELNNAFWVAPKMIATPLTPASAMELKNRDDFWKRVVAEGKQFKVITRNSETGIETLVETLTPSAKNQNLLQLTHFDKRGPWGDLQMATEDLRKGPRSSELFELTQAMPKASAKQEVLVEFGDALPHESMPTQTVNMRRKRMARGGMER